MTCRLICLALVCCAGAVTAAPAQTRTAGTPPARTWAIDAWVRYAPSSGDVTYGIGDWVVIPGVGRESIGYFPLSELRFPLSVGTYAIGTAVTLSGRWEFRGQYTGHADTNAGVVEDSDWTDPDNPGIKTIYSRSTGDLNLTIYELGARYWIPLTATAKVTFSIAPAIRYARQHFDWTLSNLDQWSPVDPAEPHVIVPGKVSTYEVTARALSGELVARLLAGRVRFDASVAYAPSATIQDRDDHILRERLSTSDNSGTSWDYGVDARYTLSPHWYIGVNVTRTTFDASGSSHTVVYGGTDAGQSWDIGFVIKGTRTTYGAALGATF